MTTTKTYFNWSTGKDASLAYYHLQKEGKYNIDRLVTTINAHYNRVSMHGLRRELLMQQVHEIGLPVTTIELPEQPTMEVYNNTMNEVVSQLQSQGYSHCGFGDIFLEDLRVYREAQLKSFNIKCCFPLWKRDTTELAQEFFSLGFKAVVICVTSKLLDQSFVGREFNQDFINDLPSNVDPCGENGEFHTFCYDGPIFNNPVKFSLGETVYKSYKQPENKSNSDNNNDMGFWFYDLEPLDS